MYFISEEKCSFVEDFWLVLYLVFLYIIVFVKFCDWWWGIMDIDRFDWYVYIIIMCCIMLIVENGINYSGFF